MTGGLRAAAASHSRVVSEREFLDLLSPIFEGEYATGLIKPRSLCHGEMTAVGEFMSRPVVSFVPATRVEDALELLRERDIRRLAIVEGGEIAGELSPKGIIAAHYVASCSMLDGS